MQCFSSEIANKIIRSANCQPSKYSPFVKTILNKSDEFFPRQISQSQNEFGGNTPKRGGRPTLEGVHLNNTRIDSIP